MMLVRYRFKTDADDIRPIVDMAEIQMPWWCSGYDINDNVYIICYLPKDENLRKYWPEAFCVEAEETSKIVYTDRFPKPEWIEPKEG